jgi:hypothetical protein
MLTGPVELEELLVQFSGLHRQARLCRALSFVGAKALAAGKCSLGGTGCERAGRGKWRAAVGTRPEVA